MFKYKTGEHVKIGDRVKVSQRWAHELAGDNRNGTVTGTTGFVTVALDGANGDKVDFDMRSLTFVSHNCTKEKS